MRLDIQKNSPIMEVFYDQVAPLPIKENKNG